MFQVAAGRSLALARNMEFRVDASGLRGPSSHQGFELPAIFDDRFIQASAKELQQVLRWRTSASVQYLLTKPIMRRLRGSSFVVEPHFHHWQGLENVSNAAYLAGYWQSPRYFLEHESEIREDFTFKQSLSGPNCSLAEKITSTHSVSLHVRRGDYVSNTKSFAKHGVCSLDYYRRAIGRMNKVNSSAVFYIFSDDLEWVRKNLDLTGQCVFVDHNQNTKSYIDMQLMSLCQHHIIANSSFSWWGAWLNPSPVKIVLAPRQWFADITNTQDLLPSEWIRI